MSEYSNIFGYSNIFFQILFIRIRIFKFCLTNIFEYSRFVPEYLRIFWNQKSYIMADLYAFKTTTYIFLNFLLKHFLQQIQLNQDLIRSSKTGCGLDSPGIPYCRLYLTRVNYLQLCVLHSFQFHYLKIQHICLLKSHIVY